MRAVKKRPDSAETMYFDFTPRLSSGETLTSCDAQPTIVSPVGSTDLTFGTLTPNTSGPLSPPPPQSQISTGKGVSALVSGGVLPEDTTSLSAILPDGTIGTAYVFSFSAVTSLGRTINEEYQLWVSNNDFAAYWTSHWELNRRFGATAINQWADVDNEGDANAALQNIWAAVTEATDDMKSQLRGAPCGVISPDVAKNAFALRLHATYLAASILYRARGTRDTSDEEGRDRFSSHVKRVDRYIKQIRAGQRRLVDGDVGVTTHPIVVTTQKPYLSPVGPCLTPGQELAQNQWSELQGIPSANSWFNSFDTFWWGWSTW